MVTNVDLYDNQHNVLPVEDHSAGLHDWLTTFVPFHWVKVSMQQLIVAEQRLLSVVRQSFSTFFVEINDKYKIWTIAVNKDADSVPLVLVHGFASGLALWSHNFDALAAHRPVYAFDTLGFGRSSRPKFSANPLFAETAFVNSIEMWRTQMNLDKFILLGHSFGGYLACSYALKYPQHVEHLILVEPWGFPDRPVNSTETRHIPVWLRAVATVLMQFNPLAGLRAVGPLGPTLLRRIRPDLGARFADAEPDALYEYIYHCNAQRPSGEEGFSAMQHYFGWARRPMLQRIPDLHHSISLSMIHGEKSWIKSDIGYQVKFLRQGLPVSVRVIKSAGHHVYVDRSDEFNDAVVSDCLIVDRRLRDADLSDTDDVS